MQFVQTAHLLRQGAACQLLFLGMVGVECLSGKQITYYLLTFNV